MMVQQLVHDIPADIIKFLLVFVFSFLIGLQQRQRHISEKFESLFGTDRTFTLLGILGFILYVIDPKTLLPFMVGGALMGLLLSLYYLEKMRQKGVYGMTSIVIAVITYCLAPLLYTQSAWIVLLIVVAVLVLTEIKESLFALTKKFNSDEFITLSKFIVIAGIILPLLPEGYISTSIQISPYRFWLAIVVVSAVSYFSYLLKKFVFPQSGIILTGLLGGLYSSTATTVILARKSKEMPGDKRVVTAIILATAMMYLRILLLAFLFNPILAVRLAPAFGVMVLLCAILSVYFIKFSYKAETTVVPTHEESIKSNPLEFKTALLFGTLFILFAVLTTFVNNNFGSSGIKLLSFVVGVTDIDPFIINLLQSKLNIAESFIVIATVNATTSNNLLKMIYGITLSDHSIRRDLITAFSILIVVGLVISFVFL